MFALCSDPQDGLAARWATRMRPLIGCCRGIGWPARAQPHHNAQDQQRSGNAKPLVARRAKRDARNGQAQQADRHQKL